MASIQQTGLAPTVQSVPAATSTPHDILNDSIAKRVDPVYSKTLQGRVQELLKIHHDGFPGSQPVSFETKHLIDLQREDYFVCEKSDGVRYLMFATQTPKGPATFLLDRNRSWFFIPHLLFPLRGKDNEYHNETLMDGELVMDIDENKNKTLRFLIFDLMVVNTQSVTQRAFSTRLGMLQQEVIQPLHNSLKKGAPFKVELKKMERSYGLALVFDQMTRLKHASDGVIFTPVKLPYTTGTCEKLLKWKPAELNTVDFRIAVKWSKEHKPIYSLEVVAQGKNYKPYDHLQLETETALEWKKSVPDGKIGEFRYDPEWNVTIVEPGYAPTKRKGGWRFVKFRDDKELANDEQVVKKILKSIQDGVTKEQLLAHMEDIRTAWKAREKGIPMPEPVTKVPNAAMKITTENLSKTLSGGPMAATPAIMSPSANPFDTYTEKRSFHQGHRDSTSSIDYMPASRKNSLADSVKEQDLSPHDINSRKQSLDDPMSLMEDSDAAEEKAHAMKNIQSPQWKEQTVHDARKRSEDALIKFNIARKQSDEISVKSTNTEPMSADSVVKQEPKTSQSDNANDSPHNAMDTSSGLVKDNETPGSAPVRVDMTLRQMIESKMPPKFRGSQGKKRSDSMKVAIDSPVLHTNPVLTRADIGFDHRDVKRSKSDSPSSSNHSPQEIRKSSLPQTTEEQQQLSAPPPIKSQPMVKSPPQSYNGKHMSDAETEAGEYRRRKMSLSGNVGTIQMDRTQSPSQEAISSGKAQKLRKIDEQPTTGNAYLPHHPPENTRAGRYEAMHDSPPMQMSSATVRHQQMWEQRASPYTIPTSKSTFAVPVSPYQAYATRNTGFNPSEMYDTPRRNSDEKAMVPHDQRQSMVNRNSSISAPPSRRPSQEDYSAYYHGKRPQPSSIADLLNNNVEATSLSSRPGTHSPSVPRHERPSSNERPTERPNPFDFAKILHSPAQPASDEEAPHPPNGRQGGSERMSEDSGYSHQYSSQTGNALHFINYRADGNQVQALTSSMEVPSRQDPASMGLGPKMYGPHHSHMSPHSNSPHSSTHSGMSSPESRHYQQQYAPANSAYVSPHMNPSSTMYHSPGSGVTRGADPRHIDNRQPQQRDHAMTTPYRQTSYPSYAYRSPVLQHSTMSSPGRSRVEYPTVGIPQQQDRNVNVSVAPDDIHRQYRRSFGSAKPYQGHSPPYSQAQTSPGARPKVIEGGDDKATGESSRKNNTKSKLDFILN